MWEIRDGDVWKACMKHDGSTVTITWSVTALSNTLSRILYSRRIVKGVVTGFPSEWVGLRGDAIFDGYEMVITFLNANEGMVEGMPKKPRYISDEERAEYQEFKDKMEDKYAPNQ